ncbi:hypothetical protein MMMDOFMJ_1697 [Methylobacterium gnaphalii]|nr:hypothetical protein MMMDOFMJ_1697 [Methylobacterium gnaphalii]
MIDEPVGEEKPVVFVTEGVAESKRVFEASFANKD